MARPRKRWPWLVVAAVLLALGAWLMTGAEAPIPERPTVSMPRRMKSDERTRNTDRETWVPVAQLDDAGLPVMKAVRPLDPVLAAMPPTVKYAAVVVEANAIRHSAIGDLLIDCLFAGRPEMLDELRDAGLDPLSSVDRISMADSTMLVSGNFSSADVKTMLHAESSQQWGRHSTLFERRAPNGQSSVAGVWNQQLLVIGRNAEDVKATLDRLEGTGSTEPPVLKPEDAYGEMYGTLTGAGLARMVSEDNPALAKVITESAGRVSLHADVTRDVGLVADIEGSDPRKTEDLRKALGSALTLTRLQAKAEGQSDEAEILQMARVGSAEDGNQFRLEAGLPFAYLEKNLKLCAERGRARRLDAGSADDE